MTLTGAMAPSPDGGVSPLGQTPGGPVAWPLVWPAGRAVLRATGAALQDLSLRLPSGRVVRPLAQAPWEAAGLSGHLARLGGEWPCVPFGSGTSDPAHHGYGSDHDWRLDALDGQGARLSIDYPGDHPVARLERQVTTRADGIDFTLTVHPREECTLPLGVHPILAWPAGGIRLRAGAARGQVFPRSFEPGASRLQPGAHFDDLAAVPLEAGGTADVAHDPAALSEELLQLHGGAPWFEADYLAERYTLRLEWEAEAFPSHLLWLSNGGRRGAPWMGRFRGLGVEPCAAAFDDAALASHLPQGLTAGQPLRAGQPWTTTYRLTLHDLKET